MTQDEILLMAREAGFESHDVSLNFSKQLKRFAKLVADHEREACAKVCEDLYAEDETVSVGECVNAIKARGEQA